MIDTLNTNSAQDIVAAVEESVMAISEQPIAEAATEMVWSWSEILWVTLIGFSLVFMLLVLLIFALKVFGMVATARKKEKKKATATPDKVAAEEEDDEHMVSEAKVAAIAIALNLYRGALHDQESEVITIQTIKRTYSPWNSKIHSLTHLPERK